MQRNVMILTQRNDIDNDGYYWPIHIIFFRHPYALLLFYFHLAGHGIIIMLQFINELLLKIF